MMVEYPTYKLTIPDTSCLILLQMLNQWAILPLLFGEIAVPRAVAHEFGAEKLPSWIVVQSPKDQQFVEALRCNLDAGEAEVIALGLEAANCFLILDDQAAWRVAQQHQLAFTGTLGVLIRARRKGFIPALKPVLDQLQETAFWLHPKWIQAALRRVGEA